MNDIDELSGCGFPVAIDEPKAAEAQSLMHRLFPVMMYPDVTSGGIVHEPLILASLKRESYSSIRSC